MEKLILVVLMGLSLVGCNLVNPGCIIQDKVVAAASAAISSQLQCTNSAQVQSDVEALIKPLGLCKSQTGIIANSFCPMVVATVVGFASKPIPASWQCSAENAKAELSAALLAACQQIPVEAK